MPTILDLELQCPLLHHCLVHLYPPETRAPVSAPSPRPRTSLPAGDLGGVRSVCSVEGGDRCAYSYGDVPFEDQSGLRSWYKDRKLHRDGDLPAVIWLDGSQTWYKDGEVHRDGDLLVT